VRESDTHAVPGARAASCLIFDSPATVRRVWLYPRDWRAASDADLLAWID
jgi:hypothetical protein